MKYVHAEAAQAGLGDCDVELETRARSSRAARGHEREAVWRTVSGVRICLLTGRMTFELDRWARGR